MEREHDLWRTHLRQAEWRVALAEQYIAEQVRLIAELERCGEDSKQARKWLIEFEELLCQHVAHLNHIKLQLHGGRQQPSIAA